jgi:hypothetical protein
MMYDTQNYGVYGFCPSSRIQNTRKHEVSETSSHSCVLFSHFVTSKIPLNYLITIEYNMQQPPKLIKLGLEQ